MIVWRLQRLMQMEGGYFIAEAYRELLDREPDPLGWEHHVNLLLSGTTKLEIIIGLIQSEEANLLYNRLP